MDKRETQNKQKNKGRSFTICHYLTTATATTLPQHSTTSATRGRGRQEQMDEGMKGIMGDDPLLTAYANG